MVKKIGGGHVCDDHDDDLRKYKTAVIYGRKSVPACDSEYVGRRGPWS